MRQTERRERQRSESRDEHENNVLKENETGNGDLVFEWGSFCDGTIQVNINNLGPKIKQQKFQKCIEIHRRNI